MSAAVTRAPSPRASLIAFRRGMRALPGAVCVIAANGVDGAPIGLTATSVTSLSADPPSLLVCVNRGAQIAAALSAGAHFSVNLLAAGQQEVAEAFGGQRVAKVLPASPSAAGTGPRTRCRCFRASTPPSNARWPNSTISRRITW